jgi:transportin-1
MVPAYQDYIKSQLIPCIWKDNALIQSIAGDVITEVLEIIHAEKWDELITSLQMCIASGVFEQLKGAMNLIFKVIISPYGLVHKYHMLFLVYCCCC